MISFEIKQPIHQIFATTLITLGLLGTNNSVFAQSSQLTSCTPSSTLASCQALKISQLKSVTTFTDIRGIRGEKEIQQLVALGVIETNSSEFQPLEPITRGEFVAWLVKTYNKLHRHPITLSERTTSAFADVPISHPYFTYIQAAHNAGYLAGFTDGNFKPDDVLTREQMIVLKTRLDANVAPSKRTPASFRNYIGKTKGFSDANDINEKYLRYIAFDLGNGASNFNFARVYGTTRIFAPQKAVTRAETAIVLSRFRKGGTVEKALQRINRGGDR